MKKKRRRSLSVACNKNVILFILSCSKKNLQLDEINQLFLPNMRNKLMWFYQEVDEPEPSVQQEQPPQQQPKPGPSRAAGTSNSSKTPQGTTI